MFAYQLTILNPICLLLGCLLPDADHRRSPIGLFIPLWALGFKHRGFTHTIWFVGIASLIMWLLWNRWAGISLAIGLLSHLFLDACTPMGVRWLGKRKSHR